MKYRRWQLIRLTITMCFAVVIVIALWYGSRIAPLFHPDVDDPHGPSWLSWPIVHGFTYLQSANLWVDYRWLISLGVLAGLAVIVTFLAKRLYSKVFDVSATVVSFVFGGAVVGAFLTLMLSVMVWTLGFSWGSGLMVTAIIFELLLFVLIAPIVALLVFSAFV